MVKGVHADRRGGGCRPSDIRKGWTWCRFNRCWRWVPVIVGSRGSLNRRWWGILGLKSSSRWTRPLLSDPWRLRPRPLLPDPWRLSRSRLWLCWGFDSSFPPESVYIDFADWGVTRSHWADRLGLTGGFLMNRIFRPRGSLYTSHDDRWGDIVLTSGGYNHVGPFEEVGDGSGVGVEETFFENWNTFSAPVDLNEFGQLGL
jgi:hypothetical protein